MASSYTEQSHPASVAIDTSSPQELAALMINEADIFTGWDGAQGLLGEEVLATITKIQAKLFHVLQDCENNAVVVAGCGTSGRFAFMTVRAMNSRLREMGKCPCFKYLMAGHDIALFKSQEGHEDDPVLGQKVLEKVAAGCRHVLYVGITCGLSAPFVAGQLDLCMRHPDRFTPVLIGFNPVHMARNVPIEKWTKTFLEVAKKMEHEQMEGQAFILNPIIGPELITGSTRMKSGSATKILLDLIFSPGNQGTPSTPSRASLQQAVSAYRSALYAVHQDENDAILGRIIEKAAFSLRRGGHICYMGATHLGLVGLIDASECPPTFGASFDDVRGFIDGGFSSLRNEEGDMSDKVQIGIEYFVKSKLPETTSSDLVVVLAREGDVSFVPDVSEQQCHAIALNVHTTPDKRLGASDASRFVEVLHVDLEGCLNGVDPSSRPSMETSLSEITAKWFCNTLSTGAYVLLGKVYRNFMVDVNVSNNKLFQRAVGIIKLLVGCTQDAARDLLLKAIYRSDDVTLEMTSKPISTHLGVSATRTKIVPLALVMGMQACTVAEANGYLLQFPVVRRAIAEQRK